MSKLGTRAAIVVALLAVGAGSISAVAAPPTKGGAAPVAERFANQELRWQPCFPEPVPGLPPGAERLECSLMTAPLDWYNQDLGTVDLLVSRLRPAEGTPKNLVLTNPGGPGEEGVIVPLLFLDPAHAAVADSSEIVGMDVRGTGQSTTITCGGATIGRERDVRDRSRENVKAMLDDAEAFADACQSASDPIGDYVNTAQTVRDFDLLRGLLGHQKTNWFGFSAGSWLGAHYATTFPKRVNRFVFDSSVQFTGTWQEIYALQPMGFERRFRQDFLPWAAKYAQVYGLGDSANAVRASYERIRAVLAEWPLDLGDMVIHATTLDSLIAGNLYGKANFPGLAEMLAGLNGALSGQTEGFTATADLADQVGELYAGARLTGAPAGAPDAIDATFYTIGCNDTRWYGDRNTLTVTSGLQGRLFPLIGWRSIAEPCVFWDRPSVELPRPTGRGVPPVLIVQSAHDPATPIEGARAAASRFAGARLLTVTGEGDHMLYGGGNQCVDAAVNAYLAGGQLPRSGATCAGGPLPDPTAPTAAPVAQRMAEFASHLPS